MNKVRVNRDNLLAIVLKNRASHRKLFEEALEGWKNAVINALTVAVDEAKKGKNFHTSFNLPRPSDHTNDYDCVIDMLEMSVDDVLEIENSLFRQYVRDDWSWTQDFLTSNRRYSVQN